MRFEFISSISEVPATQWNALWPNAYPFTQHGFFHALEESGSIDGANTNDSGWRPMHLLAWQEQTLLGAMPLFLKYHSYGEYVFDWAWADAYARAGFDYYPKLINAIPFTPATGPRIGISDEVTDASILVQQMLKHISEWANTKGCSSWHSLFPEQASAIHLPENEIALRVGCQFHWFNRDYESFDHFLESFASRKRKNVKKERKTAHAHGLDIQLNSARDLSEADWHDFYLLYQRTYLKRSGHGGYLGFDFFLRVAQLLPDNVLLTCVRNNQQLVAGSLFFRDEQCLYGRYWGAREELDQLHFEACYYQGIDYAIAEKLVRFDPGAQGEHKIQRGFTPVKTQSFHRLFHRDFQPAIEQFTQQEAEHIDHYIAQCRESLPFKDGTPIAESDILLR